MEEVPPSPEVVKRKKTRRKHGSSFARLSFQNTSSNTEIKHSHDKVPVESTKPEEKPEDRESSTQTIKSTSRVPKLSEIYFDDNSEEIQTVKGNPLASAILLEKANAIASPIRVPSAEFIAAENEEFLSVAELAKRNIDQLKDAGRTNAKKNAANYSFTQLDLDSQMINIFEAAELLACSAVEDQSKPLESAVPDEAVSDARMLSNVVMETRPENIASSIEPDPICQRNIVETILHDFEEDVGVSWEIDFSKIQPESVRQRLLQLQDYIASPPKSVKKNSVCRSYGNRKRDSMKNSVVRRLSYETDCSSRVEQPLSDDESVTHSEKTVADSDEDISMDGVALNESVLIQANLTQLSAFFSQAIVSRSESEDQPKEENREDTSLDREPPFYGFTSEPSSPISLAPDEPSSPRVLRFEFKPFEDSSDDNLQSVDNDAVTAPAQKCPHIEQLLDDDEDFLMLAHSTEEKDRTDRTTSPRGVINNEIKIPLNVGSSTARDGSIKVSDAALIKAGAMFAEEEAKMLHENEERFGSETSSTNRGQRAESTLEVQFNKLPTAHIDGCQQQIPSVAGFSTAGGISIAISAEALAKARSLFDEAEVSELDHITSLEEAKRKLKTATGTKENPVPNVPSFTGGFSTAGGSKISVSKKALEKARALFDEEEAKLHDQGSSTISCDPPFTGGFSTAGGSTIAVSKKALARAQNIFDEEESKMDIGSPFVSSDPPFVAGFSTAGGSTISVSKQALDRARTLFAENEAQIENQHVTIQRERENDPPPPMVCGFSNAAGKSLHVSELALAKARLMFEQVEQELERDQNLSLPNNNERKRKALSSQEEPTTPTKRPRMHHLQSVAVATFQTSTPASVLAKPTRSSNSNINAPAPFLAGQEVDNFFAELDDEEFVELFCNEENRPPAQEEGVKRQTKLLTKFEQCADEETTVNTSTSHWDDSFTELLPKLASDGQRKQSSSPPEDVQRQRREALQKQVEYVDSKPEEKCRRRVSTFCSKKLQPDRVGLEQFVGVGIRPTLGAVMNAGTSVTMNNVMTFRFSMIDYYGEALCNSNTTGIPIGSDGEAVLLMDHHSTVGVEEMRLCFLASLGIDPRLVPSGWVENGWRWIVTKLSALERNLNDHFAGVLTPENVFNQLQYRYHIEIDCARRPPLKKVLEKDDIPSRRMVLFVSNVFPTDGTMVDRELELSDGWYAVRTVIDSPLAAAVRQGKITIGTKLMVQGGELLNHKDGCSPLEVPPEVRLKIHTNATRRVRWPVKLGYYRCPMPFLTPCSAIVDRGGLISRLRAMVVRVYPLVYVEKSSSESRGSVLRSERMQQRHSRRNDASQLDSLHKLYNQIQQEIESERRTANTSSRNVRVTESTPCSQLQKLLEGGLDVSFLDMELTLSQQAVIQRFQQQRQEELEQEINRRVKSQMDKRSGRSSVTSLLKVRLMDRVKPDRAFVLSIWRPSDDVRFTMQEQNYLEATNITANGCKNNDVQLTAHKSSTYRTLPNPGEVSNALVRFNRAITPIASIDPPSFRPAFSEFDTIGVVVHVGSVDSKKFQSIYLADTAMELLCVNFWHGLAEYAYDDVVHERTILCVANLQWRTIGRQNQAIPQSFATEYTTFTENPRSGPQRAEWDRFQLQLDAIDADEFFQRCQEKVRELKDTVGGIGTLATATTGSFSTPNAQRSMSRMLLAQHSTPLGAGGGGSLAQRKIETLSTIYGSPPKLSPIVIRSNPILRKGFKTPARLDDGHSGSPASKN
ncbi:breast cancer type 2 susceptibility protein homolog [Anopheles ziemanni]|uniref:breast cancer type 2 susceptibility protein homolog n=1 Tax=Anopheles ziemanni TaxID=345580 RepID=UPI00265EBAF6|nr:breast cancer type 2 susceptibility protein homolog [Anopheles ziemanni]